MSDRKLPHAARFILITILIDAVGFGLIMPVLPRLLMQVGALRLPQAIEVGAWMGLAVAIASFAAAPILGNLSDRYGRRPVLLAALGALAVDQLLLAVADTLVLIVIGRILAGAFGGSYGTAQAALADITEPTTGLAPSATLAPPLGSGSSLVPRSAGCSANWASARHSMRRRPYVWSIWSMA